MYVNLMGDFNMTTSNPILSQFLDMFPLSPLNVSPNCFKNSKTPSCIDLLLTNLKLIFMKANVFETVISDHHKMISSIILQEKVLKQNTSEIIDKVIMNLVLNSLAN